MACTHIATVLTQSGGRATGSQPSGVRRRRPSHGVLYRLLVTDDAGSGDFIPCPARNHPESRVVPESVDVWKISSSLELDKGPGLGIDIAESHCSLQRLMGYRQSLNQGARFQGTLPLLLWPCYPSAGERAENGPTLAGGNSKRGLPWRHCSSPEDRRSKMEHAEPPLSPRMIGRWLARPQQDIACTRGCRM